MTATVRAARRDDVAGILAITNDAALHTAANFAIEPEPLDDWLATFDAEAKQFPWLVATGATDADIIAFAKGSPWKGRCAYNYSAEITVYVAPAFHRKGLGRALYAQLVPELERRGYRAIIAGITLPNEASVRLHESLGMHQVACFERIGFKFETWHDVGYWMMHVGEDAAPE